jgi:opacity protein-like surface antigen
MSKFIRGCFALALVLMLSTPALSKELTTYMSCNVGGTLLQDSDLTDISTRATYEYEPGYFVGLAFGNHVDKLRFEAEIGYQKNKVDSVNVSGVSVSIDNQEIRLTTLMFNLYYDFLKGSRFTPYLSGGLGLGNMKLDGASKSDAVAEYQFGAGVAFRINEKIALDLKGRYLGTTDAEFGTSSLDFTTINAIFDVRIYF